MKKLISILLVCMLMVGMGTPAFAADNYSQDVTVTYNAGNTAGAPVISVDVDWQGFDFTYNAASYKVWDPVSLSYSGQDTPEGWARSDARITVTNNSNAFLECNLSYAATAEYNSANVVFSATRFGVGNADCIKDGVGQAQSTTITAVPTGTIPTNTNEATIGTITIQILSETDLEAVRNILTGNLIENPGVESAPTVHGTKYIVNSDRDDLGADVDDVDRLIANTSDKYEKIAALNTLIPEFFSKFKIAQ